MINGQEENIAGASIKALLVALAVLVSLGVYVGIIIYGENSLPVLQSLEKKVASLERQRSALEKENMRLQKRFFELKQLDPEGYR